MRRSSGLGAWSVVLLWAMALVCRPGAAFAQDIDIDLLAGMKARAIGPATMSGRIAAIDAVVADPRIIYVGAATGGLWKTTNGGLEWTPLFDDQEAHAVGAVAIFQRSPDLVWVGTGEGNPRNSASVGNGVYRSRDGGKTWVHLGLAKTERIHRICLHPTDPDVAYVAAMGTSWGENSERGVYRTTDGGRSWERILFVDERTGCADLAIDPTNPAKLFAAMWDHRRWPWSFRSGGPGSGLFVTDDGGNHWQRRTEDDGLPAGDLGRIGLAIAPSAPHVVYAYVEARENCICRSDDGGVTWRVVSTGQDIGNRPFYYADLRVDPVDPKRVYSLWSLVSVSIDGGKNFEILVPFAEVHPDHHALWINPTDPRHLINGNDGGVAISHDQGRTWRYVRNLPLAQFYHVRYDLERPYNLYGGLQDNGSWKGPSTVWENGGIRNYHWQEVAFGDGFDTVPDPRDPTTGYAMSQEGYLCRWNTVTGERKMIRPEGPAGVELRFNWNAAIAIDGSQPDTIYFGSQFVHRSRDRGETWDVISGDLTTNHPEWQQQTRSGGLTPDVTGAENFTTIVALAPSPLDSSILWVGTDDGRLHVTRDAGASWTSLEERVPGVPRHAWIPHITPSQHHDGTAYVVFDDHRRSNWEPYLFRTRDFGQTWTRLAGAGVSGYCLAVAEDPVDPDLLFLGTEFGLYLSCDGGARWQRWSHGVPHASVMDLAIHPREHDLIVATHGRALFVLDDIRPLRGLTGEKLAAPLTLFEIPPAQQYWVAQTGSSRFAGHEEFRGASRPYGALITFALNGDGLPHPDEQQERLRKERARAARATLGDGPEPRAPGEGAAESKADPKPEVEIQIATRDGTVIRTFKQSAKLGINRVVWNLRQKGFRSPRDPDAPQPSADAEEPQGPEVVPGDYRLTVKYQDYVASGVVQVLADPRLPIPLAERERKRSAQLQVAQWIETLAIALERIGEVRGDLTRVTEKSVQRDRQLGVKRKAGEETELAQRVQQLRKGLDEVEKRLRKPDESKGILADDTALDLLYRASWFLGSSWDAPTAAQQVLMERASSQLQSVLDSLDELLAREVPALRALAVGEGFDLFQPQEPLRLWLPR
ncbi:MAG: WD40/YVTN/BNR-like repeat-containing protein [Planctomycetota bacterium]